MHKELLEEIARLSSTCPEFPTGDKVSEYLGLYLKRHVFLKSLPYGANVLDVGAGEGSLANVAIWLPPIRADINFYGISLQQGKFFDKYKAIEIKNFDENLPDFDGIQFDAIFSSHFIEHVADPEKFFSWSYSRLKRNGRAYTECPSHFALSAPTTKQLAEIGLTVATGNYFDDGSHKKGFPFHDLPELVSVINKVGFFIEESGYLGDPFLEHALLYHGKKQADIWLSTIGFWLKTRWAQYVIAEKR